MRAWLSHLAFWSGFRVREWRSLLQSSYGLKGHPGFEGTEYGVAVGVEHDGGFAELVVEDAVGGGGGGQLCVGEEFIAMIVDGVVGVFEGVAGEDEDGALLGADAAIGDELFEACEGDGGSWFAADAFGADLGLGEGDFGFGDLLAPAAGGLEGLHGFLPARGIADANGGGAGFGGDGGEFGAVVVAYGLKERVCTFGLDDGDFGEAGDKAELAHFREALGKGGGVGEIAAGDDYVLGDLPVHLFEELDSGSFLAFEAVRIDGVEEVDGEAPDELVDELDAAVEVCSELDGEGTVVHGLGELAPGDFAFGDEDDGAEAGAGSVGSHGGGGVAG